MKNSYILLRNNTESTPLYAEDLQRIGLKANDLVWVECQSVCWQNPHEIPELRPLVSADNSVQEKNVAVTTEETVRYADTVQPTPLNNITVNKEVVKPVPDYAFSDMEKYGGLNSNTDFSVAGKKETAVKTNNTRSLDEIKEKFIRNGEEKGKKIIVDLAIPADVDATVAALKNVHYIGIENLKSIARENLEHRQKELERCKEIIDSALTAFKKTMREREVEIAMKTLPGLLKEIRENATEKVFSKEVEKLDPQSKEVLKKILDYMEGKYISVPMKITKNILVKDE